MEQSTDNHRSGTATWLMAGGLAIIVLVIGAVVVRQQLQRPAGPPLPIISGITDFSLTNQLGEKVTLGDLRGHVTVANVIFTRCPSACLVMSHQFAELQKKLPADGSVRLLSLTIDPEYDSPQVLATYGKKLGNDPKKWWFLTGDNKELRRLELDDFKFIAVPKDATTQESKDDLFIHSTYFMILDDRARVRAVIESTDPDALERTMKLVDQLNVQS